MTKVSINKQKFQKGQEISVIDEPNIQLNDVDSIEDMFRNEQQANQDNVKELFYENTVKARTDINARQIKLATKCIFLAKITGMNDINVIVKDFLTLSISKDRKSRQEYVEGLKAKIDNQIQQGMMNVRGQFGK
jgi:hypothetical protein